MADEGKVREVTAKIEEGKQRIAALEAAKGEKLQEAKQVDAERDAVNRERQKMMQQQKKLMTLETRVAIDFLLSEPYPRPTVLCLVGTD